MDKQIKAEIKGLIKSGFPEDIAIITACANHGKPEQAIEYLEELNEDQNEIMMAIELMGMRPFHEVIAIEIADEPKEMQQITETNEMIYQTALELKQILTITDISGAAVTEK